MFHISSSAHRDAGEIGPPTWSGTGAMARFPPAHGGNPMIPVDSAAEGGGEGSRPHKSSPLQRDERDGH